MTTFDDLFTKISEAFDPRKIHGGIDPSKERSVRGVDTSMVTQYTDADPNRAKKPADKGFQLERSLQSIIRNGIRLLKTDTTFREKLNTLFKNYRSELHKLSDIDSDTENILRRHPSEIQRFQSKITGYESQIEGIIKELDRKHSYRDDITNKETEYSLSADQIKELEERIDTINARIGEAKKKMGKLEAEVKWAYDHAETEIAPITDKYVPLIVDLIRSTAATVYNEIKKESETAPAEIELHGLDQLDPEYFNVDRLSEDSVKLELLKMLESDDYTFNPVIRFLEMKKEGFNLRDVLSGVYDSKQGSADWVNITRNKLDNALPVSQLVRYYNFIRGDEPLKTFTVQQKQTKSKVASGMSLLNIKSKEEFEAKKEEIRALINGLNVDEGRKAAALSILNEPFVRRGRTAVDRLRGLLGGVVSDMSRESFDATFASMMRRFL